MPLHQSSTEEEKPNLDNALTHPCQKLTDIPRALDFYRRPIMRVVIDALERIFQTCDIRFSPQFINQIRNLTFDFDHDKKLFKQHDEDLRQLLNTHWDTQVEPYLEKRLGFFLTREQHQNDWVMKDWMEDRPGVVNPIKRYLLGLRDVINSGNSTEY